MKSSISCRFFKTSCLTSLIIALTLGAILPEPSLAKKRRRSSGGGGGAVMLKTPNPRNPLEHNNRGVELGSKGLWPDAIREHELALAGDPYNQQFRTNLSGAQLRYGTVLFGKGKTYEAIKQFRGALYIDPNNHPADQSLDAALRKLGKNPDDLKTRQKMAEDADVSGDYETAIVEYRKCVKMTDSGPMHAQLGYVLKKANKIVDAFTEMKIAVNKTWSENEKAAAAACHRELGDILKDYAYIAKNNGRGTDGLKRLLNASIEYRRACALNPSDANAQRGLIEVSREAVAIVPNSFDNHLMLAGAYQLAGDFERAKEQYQKAWSINKNDRRLPVARRSFYLSVASSPLSSPKILVDTTNKVANALSKKPNDALMLYVYGLCKEKQGETDEALGAFRKAAAINPYIHPDLQSAIQRITGEAPTETASATPAAPTKEDLAKKKEEAERAKALLKYGEIESMLRQGELDEAQKQLLAMVEKNPKDGKAWLYMGNIHEKKGDLDQAVVAYRQASYLNEKDADSALRQINTSRVQPILEEADKASKAGNWVKAAASLREASSIAPKLPIVHKRLAEALRKLGNDKEAKRELEKARKLESTDSSDESSKSDEKK